ncbi:NlpC/P60 family protein [Planotetraspora sp. A-T 1434]|uniref:C40 family peptidase n=1 Tax=Planotetraspora sp. A-T 1434 TaxID=2979219 RepID=UPI0021C0FD3E|nr:NlpC/P60 family protein [Planotetraspora sp. A-T 1434]MCT9931929.1 NlpC/P60 family protein [Planotetraspora sp. A-T 1434]
MGSVRGWLTLGVAVLALAAASAPLNDELSKAVTVAYATQGAVPYSWGGGHGALPGPSRGTCRGYHGAVRPCPAEKTRGLDCSGFTRWVYRQAFGDDVLGRGNTDDHIRRLRRVEVPQAGDLVFYGTDNKTHHVGVYVGGGKMINAFATGTRIRMDDVTVLKDLVGYYHYPA